MSFQQRFAARISKIGKTMLLRKRIEGTVTVWLDYFVFADLQRIKDTHDLIVAGILNRGSAIAYFKVGTEITTSPQSKIPEVDDQVIYDAEYKVFSVDPNRVGHQTAFYTVLLNRRFESEQGDIAHTPDETDSF